MGYLEFLPTGLSAQAIAGYGTNHPHDPSDLLRCVRFCESASLTTKDLKRRMAGRSIYWDRLLPEWDELVAMLKRETSGPGAWRAPFTYRAMRRLLDDGIKCTTCDGSGVGAYCEKCRGSGRRTSGTCRAPGCDHGFQGCAECDGRGYFRKS